MEPEDLELRLKAPKLKPLDDMSIGDLESYIAELEAEIARVRAMIDSKGGARLAAESVFKR